MRLEDRFRGLDWAQQSGIITMVLYTGGNAVAGMPGEESTYFAPTVDLVLQKMSRTLDPQPCVPFFDSEPTTLDRWVQNYGIHNLTLKFYNQDNTSFAQAHHLGAILLGKDPILATDGGCFLEAYDTLKEALTDEFIDTYMTREFEKISRG